MSWSIYNVTGRGKALQAEIEAYKTKNICSEPEETIRQKTIEIILFSLQAMSDKFPVTINASGSQSNDGDGFATNQLQLTIQPIWGFKE